MYDVVKLLTVLTDPVYRVVDENGKVFLPSNEIYKLIERQMDGNPKAKHIYTIIKNNRQGVYNSLLRAFSITLPIDETKMDESFNPNISAPLITADKFDITISAKEWLSIKQQEVKYKDGKKYVILKHGWTDLFATKIWEKFAFFAFGHLNMLKVILKKREKMHQLK